MKKTLFIFWLLATAIGLLAQDGFLCQETRLSREQWEAGAARLSSLRPASTTADPRPRFGLLGKEGATSIGNYADEAGPEIESLARGLLNDPLRIYNHVHDQIEYEHYFGCKKGALMTLLEGRGNDFDQCTLLVSLLRTSGYQASYVLGFMEIPYESPDGYDMKAWIGFRPSFDPANPDLVSDLVSSFLRNRGTPLTAFLTQTKTVLLPRVWVRAVVDGKRCDLDPSFKRRQFSPALDWASAINLNRQGLLDACRGTAGQNYASGLDGAALSRYLAAKTGDFLAWLHREHPNLTSGELFGQPVSVRDSLTALPASLRFNLITNADLGRLGQLNFPPAVFESVPETLMSLFAIESDANHVRMPFPWLADKTLTLTMDRLLNGVPQASVRVNDDLLDGMQEISGTGNFLHLKLSFLHPHGTLDLTSNTIITNGISDEVETLDLRRYLAVPGRIPCYAFSHAFSPSAKLLRRWTDRLQDRLRNGEPSNSMPVVRESLNVLGLNYWLQCRDVMSFTARLRGMDHLNAHLCLIVGQSEGYYLDVKALTAKTLSLTGRAAADNRVADEALSTSAFFSSALEHGVIEQQPGYTNRAASTIRVLQRANELGLKIYFSENADDYVHHIQSNLRHYPDPSPITAAATNGCLLLFPEDGNIGIGSGTWKGFGYVSWRLSTNQDRIAAMAMMLNGEVGGGMTDNQCLINPGRGQDPGAH